MTKCDLPQKVCIYSISVLNDDEWVEFLELLTSHLLTLNNHLGEVIHQLTYVNSLHLLVFSRSIQYILHVLTTSALIFLE